jgi:hypothetical protein
MYEVRTDVHIPQGFWDCSSFRYFAQTDNLNTQIDDTAQATQSIAKEGAVHAEQKSYQRQAIDAYEVSK